MKLITRKKKGVSIIEIVLSLMLLTMLSFVLMRENVTSIRQRMWGLRFIMAQSTLNQYESIAKTIDKDQLDPTISTISTNPWHNDTINATAEKIQIGSIPSSTSSAEADSSPVEAYLVRSHSTAPLGAIDLEQSIVFKSGGFFYKINSTVRR